MPWLIKSDPEEYGWNELIKDKSVSWDGVRNYAARNHLRSMKKGDDVLFYHSGKESAVVGIAKVGKEFYKDPTVEDDTWSSVEIVAVSPLKKYISLSMIKAEKKLKDMLLIKISRLSVMPVTKEEFDLILQMGS